MICKSKKIKNRQLIDWKSIKNCNNSSKTDIKSSIRAIDTKSSFKFSKKNTFYKISTLKQFIKIYSKTKTFLQIKIINY